MAEPARLRSWRVTTTGGSVLVLAATKAAAITSGLELTGDPRRVQLLSCLEQGEW